MTIQERLEAVMTAEPNEDYHDRSRSGEFLSSHKLALFRQDPTLYAASMAGTMREPEREAFTVGSATHTLILEGREAFDREYIVGGPVNEKTGKTYGRDTAKFAAWIAENANGRPVLGDGEYELIQSMEAAVQSHSIARGMVNRPGIVEHVCRATVMGVPCQARPDKVWIDADGVLHILDLKTCADLDKFHWNVRDYGYAEQLAFYATTMGVAMTLPHRCELHIVAVEKQAPYRVGVFELGQARRSDAFRTIGEDMSAFARYKETGRVIGKYDEINYL
jgi:hypothetical protein